MAEKRSYAQVMSCPPPAKRLADAHWSNMTTPCKAVLSCKTYRAVIDIGVRVIVDTCNHVGRDADMSIFSSDDAEARVFTSSVVLLENYIHKTVTVECAGTQNNGVYNKELLVAVPLACFLLALRTRDFHSPEHKFLIDLMNSLEVPEEFKFDSLLLETTERKVHHFMHSEVDTSTAMDVLDTLSLPVDIPQKTVLGVISSIKAAYCHTHLRSLGPHIIALGALHVNGVHAPTSSNVKCLKTFINVYRTHLKNVTRYV